MNVYLIQSTDCLKPYAIQNAIVVAENRSIAIKNSLKSYAIIHIVNRAIGQLGFHAGKLIQINQKC